MNKNFNNKLGFTLIEVLVVIAIIGIIGAVGVPWYQGYKTQAKEKQAINNLQSIKLAQTQFYRDWDHYYPCPVTTTDTDMIADNLGLIDLNRGAYNYEITGGCATYTVLATPK